MNDNDSSDDNEKRFAIKKDGINQYTVSDKLNQFGMPVTSEMNCKIVAYALNSLWDKVLRFEKYNQEHLEENDRLREDKQDLQIMLNQCRDQRNEFHRGARENANRVGKLERENERLTNRVLECEAIIYALKKKYGEN